MKARRFTPVTKLFEYDSLILLYSRVVNVIIVVMFIIILSGFTSADYSSMSHLGLLTARSILLTVILLTSILLSRRIKPTSRTPRKRSPLITIDHKSFYLIMSVSLMVAAVYLVFLT
ncbi:MAG: hypothetical protein QXE81_02225 [Desulfurococcaceae archaeon]